MIVVISAPLAARACPAPLLGRGCTRARWGKRRVEPLSALIGQRYDTRAALCEALRAAGATALGDDLDDTFWRWTDRGYTRFLKAFDWLLAYRQLLPQWAQTMAVAKTIQTVLKTHGLSRACNIGSGAGRVGQARHAGGRGGRVPRDRKSTRLNSSHYS